MHDVALPANGPREAPLHAYRYNLRLLRRLIRSVRASNPSVSFVWRQTAYPTALVDTAGGSWSSTSRKFMCDKFSYPASYPKLVTLLNDAARRTFAGEDGVTVWEEPALLTFSAPTASFHFGEPVHHDTCGPSAERGKRGSYRWTWACAHSKLSGNRTVDWPPGSPKNLDGKGPWTATGGLSYAVTQTLLAGVLGCAGAGGCEAA